MKKLLLFALLAIVAGLQQLKAQEAYVVYTLGNKTLTFYYDNQKESRSGNVYGINETTDYFGERIPAWVGPYSPSPTYAVFAASFANARPTTTKSWFNSKSQLLSITGMEYLNTSEVTDMSGMFAGCQNLISLDVSGFNTAKVTNMESMFYQCNSLTSLDVSNFNTAKVTNMESMFEYCQSLTSLDVSNFNTSNVTNMSNMFSECGDVTSLDVSHFNTSNVTNMKNMFNECSGLTSLDVSHFNTENVTNMEGMFYYCHSLTSLDVSNFNTENVTTMYCMFMMCWDLTSLDVNHFDTKNVENMSSMFERCHGLSILDLSNWDTSNLTETNFMFGYCSSLTTIMVGDGWNMDKVVPSDSNGAPSEFMFESSYNLVGGQGTIYDDSHTDGSYAHIDGGTSNPGYFSIATYNLWVAGTQIDGANKDDVLGNGLVSYNPSTKTLTLKGGTIQANNTDSSANYRLGCGIYSEVDGLTIDVQGNTTVQGDYEKSYDGIYLKKNTTITGTAQLTGKGNFGIIAGYRDGSTNLTIGGDVTVVAEGTGSCGLIGEYRYFKGQYTYYATLAIKDNATVKAKGANNTTSLGLWQDFTLSSYHGITAPSGAEWNASQHCICYADGTLVQGEWVVIERTSLRGDVNLDKSVDIADAVCVLNAMAGQPVAGDANVNGDYDDNGNPVIDIADLVTVLNIMAGQ